MALGMETNGYPVVMPSNNDNFGGGIGSLLIGALLFGGGLGRGGFGGWGMGGGPAASAVATDVTLAPQFNSIQTQLQGLQNQISQGNITSELESMESDLTSGFLNVLGGVKDNANLYLQGTGQLSTAIANGNFTTLSSLNQALAALTAQNNQSTLQTLNSFNAVNTSMLQGFNEVGRDNAAAFNQVNMI